ncbi:hypothetical protein ATANTOWER_028204 [Ataeniobius toweri]|uniref:Uncharacterized protein n=1 Tax=Ataeniobius toweri TaxID=208326 RepID=A0ABU7AHP1_9TELE|nr:hypothetical protein [Ataeniobius toweri]
MASRLLFGLGPAGSREEQPGHQALSDESRPQLRRTRRRHVPRFSSPHEGVLDCSLSDPSPRACLPWDTLPGAFKPQTTYPLGSFEHSDPSTTLRWRLKEGSLI